MKTEKCKTHHKENKRIALLICITMALLCLAACATGTRRQDGTQVEAEISSGSSPSAEEAEAPEEDSLAGDGAKAEFPQPCAGYLELLEFIRREGRDPNGVEYPGAEAGQFENNAFAICDVDGDGRQELLFNFNESSLADMRETVFDYDRKANILREELTAWVDTEYYSNGIVKASMSHNHGKDPAGRGICPYLVYEYDEDEEIYRERYRVDAWDGELYEENFPMELDTDGDKLLYCVNAAGVEGDSSAEDMEIKIMDGEEYRLWAEELMPSWCRIEPAYRPVTEKSAESIRSAWAQACAYGAQVERWLQEDDEFGLTLRDCLLYDMDRDGKLELVTSIMEGTGMYSDNHFYGLAASGEAEELPIVRLHNGKKTENVDDFDIGGSTRVQAYECDGIFYYEGNDYVREGVYGIWAKNGFYYLKDGTVYQDSIRSSEQLFADGEQRKEDETRYYNMAWEEITKEQYDALRDDYIRDKQETAVYQDWARFSQDELEGGRLTKEEIVSRLFYSFLGSR